MVIVNLHTYRCNYNWTGVGANALAALASGLWAVNAGGGSDSAEDY